MLLVRSQQYPRLGVDLGSKRLLQAGALRGSPFARNGHFSLSQQCEHPTREGLRNRVCIRSHRIQFTLQRAILMPLEQIEKSRKLLLVDLPVAIGISSPGQQRADRSTPLTLGNRLRTEN